MLTLNQKLDMLKDPDKPNTNFMNDAVLRPISQFNIGISQMMGLPEVGANLVRKTLGYEEDSIFPSSKEIQQKMSDWNMTYAPGEEPDALSDRIYQNLGASSIPFFGLMKKGLGVGKLATSELMAASGGALGGKGLENTSWGQENPMMARAVGELFGGLGGASIENIKNIATTPGMAVYKLAAKPFSGRAAYDRASRRLGQDIPDINKSIDELTTTGKTTEPAVIGLKHRFEADSPVLKSQGDVDRSVELSKLTQVQSGIGKARDYLNRQFTKLANESLDGFNLIKAKGNAEFYSTEVVGKLNNVYKQARHAESTVWKALEKGNSIVPSSTLKTYQSEVNNITRGGSMDDIDDFLTKKLGLPDETGVLQGGQFINPEHATANAKELHQFYSTIGNKIRQVAKEPGNANRLRILNKMKSSVMKDLEKNFVGDDYKAAISFSKDLNTKFTQGAIGNVLGFNRGLATPEVLALDKLLAGGGKESRLAVDQLFKSTPEAKKDIEGYLKTRFADVAEAKNGRIHVNNGDRFLKNNNKLLEAFPELKVDIENAISKQQKVDEFLGVNKISDTSPLVKSKSAAALYLGSEPGDEMGRLLKYARSQGETSGYLNDIVKLVGEDTTGKALAGVKGAFKEELINSSVIAGSKYIDPVTQEPFISGSKFLKSLNRLEKPLLNSKLLDKSEVDALRVIGNSFKRLEKEVTTPAAKRVLTDYPGRAMDLLARMTGAGLGGKIGAGSAGGSLQMAGIGSGLVKDLANHITKDEAKTALLRATQDPSFLKDLLVNYKKLNKLDQGSLFSRIAYKIKQGTMDGVDKLSTIQTPVSSVMPTVVHGIQGSSASDDRPPLEDMLKLPLEDKLRMLTGE